MTKAILLFSAFILFCSSSFGQSFLWAKQLGGDSTESPYSMARDAAGNIYSTGSFTKTVDFDPGSNTFNLTADGTDEDIFISKLDSIGNFVWAGRIGGPGTDISFSITADAAGYVYFTGSFKGTVDFEPGAGIYNLNGIGLYDLFVAKLDPSGRLVWAKSMGAAAGAGNAFGARICLDTLGNVYTAGNFDGQLDFDPGPGTTKLTSAGYQDIFILRLDTSGNFAWAKRIGGTDFELNVNLEMEASGNIYMGGAFKGKCDFDPGLPAFFVTSTGNYDGFILKLDASGNFIWVRTFGGTPSELPAGIESDAAGNVYATGVFDGTADFDPGAGTANLTPAGGNDVFILKFDSSGALAWAKSISCPGNDLGTAIATDASGNVFVTGSFGGTADFDPGIAHKYLSATGSNDIFICKLSDVGNFMWARNIGGSAYDLARCLSVDAQQHVYLYGYFNSTADFDPGAVIFPLSSAGRSDLFLLKLGKCDAPITSQPVKITVNEGTNVFFSVTASGPAAAYQWQQNSGSGYVNLSNGGQYSGVLKDTLKISAVTLAQDGFLFRCIVTDGGCADTSENASLTVLDVTGIGEISPRPFISVFPNPADDNFSIFSSASAPVSFSISDALGRQILSAETCGPETIIDISTFCRGLYFVKLEGEKYAAIKLLKR